MSVLFDVVGKFLGFVCVLEDLGFCRTMAMALGLALGLKIRLLYSYAEYSYVPVWLLIS